MKKILLATTLIVAGSSAMADITFSGYGRFGVKYSNDVADGAQKTFLAGRVRYNINGSTTTDSGASFGGRIRIESNFGLNRGFDPENGDGTQHYSGALLSMDAAGLHAEFGNVNTAYDSAALLYDSEIGFDDSSFGDPQGAYYSFNSGAVAPSYAGIYAAYTIAGFSIQASAVDDDQSDKSNNIESSLAVSYSAGALTVSAAGYHNGAGSEDNNGAFVGVAYKINDVAKVGLNYMDEDASAVGKVTTLYGSYVLGAITLKAYVADGSYDTVGDIDGAESLDTTYGVGADYALGGGARVSGGVEKSYTGNTVANFGVRFDF
jgi:outer membrane protein OmpU